ncbi:MAG TPA: hypothetical protein VHF86_01130 [Xanthomonadaceae bacterium]|nr:hypothetical protein [Xanthomonadaceae bacterium]
MFAELREGSATALAFLAVLTAFLAVLAAFLAIALAFLTVAFFALILVSHDFYLLLLGDTTVAG